MGSYVYLLDDEKTYKLFSLKSQEFAFGVDSSCRIFPAV